MHALHALLLCPRLRLTWCTVLQAYQQAGTDEQRRKYMLAIGHLLQGVPQAVLTSHFDQVLPVVFDSLDGADPTAAQASLELLASMLSSSPELLEGHAGSLIKRGLGLIQLPAPLAVRRAALRCLTHVAYMFESTKVRFV